VWRLHVIDLELIPQVASRFRALSDAGRLSLLASLQLGERSVSDLVEATGRSQPNVSQHLASLQRAGLVEGRREGNRVYYRIVDPTVLRICDAVCDSLVARNRTGRWHRNAAGARRRRRVGGGE
jgi:DNA-binding transcriptional ArsR family regulator